jgi:hypothetical protein
LRSDSKVYQSRVAKREPTVQLFEGGIHFARGSIKDGTLHAHRAILTLRHVSEHVRGQPSRPSCGVDTLHFRAGVFQAR